MGLPYIVVLACMSESIDRREKANLMVRTVFCKVFAKNDGFRSEFDDYFLYYYSYHKNETIKMV